MEKKSFFYKLKYRLPYRLYTCMALAFLPFCLAVLLLAVMVLVRANDQILQSYRAQLEGGMYRLEQNTRLVETGMDEFVSEYLQELNARMPSEDLILPYDMLSRLNGIFGNTQQAGLISLWEKGSDRTLVQDVGMKETAREIDRLTAQAGDVLRQENLSDVSRIQLGDLHFLIREFDYQNYRVAFWFDLGSNLAETLSDFLEKGDSVYLTDGVSVCRVDRGGSVEVLDLPWETCVEGGILSQTILWESESLPLQVGIRLANGGLGLIPGPYWLLVLPALGCMCLIPLFWKLLRLEVLIPFEKLQKGMEEMKSDHLSYRIGDRSRRNSEEVQYLFDSFDGMAAEMEHSREKDQKMYQARLDNLRLQVNPHMLLNAFNMIYSLAQSQNYKCIQDYSMHLVEYFRYALRKNDDMVPLSQELEFVENYIEMQKIRTPNAFSAVYQMEKGCESALVPPLLVQNFVENAMKYALKPGQLVEVLLNLRRQEDRLLISVSDTGRGIKPEILAQLQKGEPYVDRLGNRHIGVWNCIRRIEAFYGEKAKVSITSALGEGTQVFIDLPFVEESERREGQDETDDRGR